MATELRVGLLVLPTAVPRALGISPSQSGLSRGKETLALCLALARPLRLFPFLQVPQRLRWDPPQPPLAFPNAWVSAQRAGENRVFA